MNEEKEKVENTEENYDADHYDFTDDAKEETPASFHVHEPEPPASATVSGSRENKGRNVMYAAIYVVGILFVLTAAGFAFLYYRSGGNAQNANIKVEKTRTVGNNASGDDVSDPTYDEAAKLVKPVVAASPVGSPPPTNQTGQVPPTTPSTSGGILNEPTTGYTLGGNDYISPNPKVSNNSSNPVPKSGNTASSSGGGGGNAPKFPTTAENDEKTASTDKPVFPRLTSNKPETTSVFASNDFSTSGNDGRTSIYYYASSVPETVSKQVNSRYENDKYPKTLPFGTILPVRLLGAMHSLATNGLARMELTRAVSDGNFLLPRGTQFVGRISGSAADRIFVELLGYLDARGNLVSMTGDVLNTDGSIGIQGKRMRIGSKWKRYLSPIAETARQFGLAYLQKRTGSNVVVLPQSSGFPVLGGGNSDNRSENAEFVSVAAGGFAYIFINKLTPATDSSDSLGDERLGGFSPSQEIKAITSDSIDADKNLEKLSPEVRRQIARSK